MSITDYRDNGKLVLTPIYLVFGLSAPIWFDLMRFGEIKLSSFAGLASVGIGDSFASIVGKKYGRSRIFRDGKSVEGKRFKKIREGKVGCVYPLVIVSLLPHAAWVMPNSEQMTIGNANPTFKFASLNR